MNHAPSLPSASARPNPIRKWGRRIVLAFLLAASYGLGTLQGNPAGTSPSGLHVVQVHPTGQMTPSEVDRIMVEFGSPLSPDTVRPDALRLDPPVPGVVCLDGSRRLLYRLSEKLKSATAYRILLSPTVRGERGQVPFPLIASFSTPPLTVRSIRQAGLTARGAPLAALTFSDPVEPEDLLRHIEVNSLGKKVLKVKLYDTQPGREIRLSLPSEAPHRVSVRVRRGLRGIGGPLGLSKAWTSDLHLSDRLSFLGMTAGHGSDRPYVRIRFNMSVDPVEARSFIRVEPALPLALDGSWRGIRLYGDFKPGKRYRVTLDKELPSERGGRLRATVARTVWVPDRLPSLAFALSGRVLSPRGLLLIPVRSVNMEKARLRVHRLYPSNLVAFALQEHSWNPGELGTFVAEKSLSLKAGRNEEKETLLSLRDFSDSDPRGIYHLELRRPDRTWWRSRTVAVVSDLGLTARLSPRQAVVWVTSLRSAQPVEGVRVTVFSRTRQSLGTARTDKKGLAFLDLPRQPDGEEPALVIAELGAEVNYLHLEQSARSRGTASAGSRPYLSHGLEAFLFPERGVYRPGDKVRLSGLIRCSDQSPPAPMPVELFVKLPDGRPFHRRVVSTDEQGRLTTTLTLPFDVPTGRFEISARAPGSESSWGRTAFRAAEYIPRTLRMTVKAEKGIRPVRSPFEVRVRAEHLFGGPARERKTRLRVRFRPGSFTPPGWKGYTFGRRGNGAGRTWIREKEGVTGPDGRVTFSIDPPNVKSHAVLVGAVDAEVHEPGGRALVESLYRSFSVWPAYLGLRLPKTEPRPGVPFTAEVALVAPGGKVKDSSSPVVLEVCRVKWRNVLRRTSGRKYAYAWTRQETCLNTIQGILSHGRASLSLTVPCSGSFLLKARLPGACPTRRDLWISGPDAAWVSENPDRLNLSLDRASYRPGQTARVSVRAPFSGTALVCVERDRVVSTRVLKLVGGKGSFFVNVEEVHRPNAYVTVTLLRPVTPEKAWKPHRASGAVRLPVDNGDRRLEVILQSPREARPKSKLPVRVQVLAGDRPASNTAVILYAVDEGVLALTRHRDPDPHGYFYARRRLDVGEYDLFSDLAPELSAWKLSAEAKPGGGDRDRPSDLGRLLNPIRVHRVRTAVLYAGCLVTDAQGVATAVFTAPQTLTELRVTAVAARNRTFGKASLPVTIRCPFMIRPSWPRFLAPGDRFDLPVTLYNRTAKAGKAQVRLSWQGPLLARHSGLSEVDLKAGGETTIHFPLTATGPGRISAVVRGRFAQETCRSSCDVSVRPPCAPVSRTGSVQVSPGREKTVRLAGKFLEGTGTGSVVIGGHPMVELSGAVASLLDYPHGCVEQTTSRMVPLLYLPDLATLSRPGSMGPEEIEPLLASGFQRLTTMKTAHGGLSMWPGGTTPVPWGSIYAADLCVEADKAGTPVPPSLIEPLLDYLRKHIETWTEQAHEADEGRHRAAYAAYAGYVLARAGKAPWAQLVSLEELFSSPRGSHVDLTARCHLAAALALAGERKRAGRLLSGKFSLVKTRATRGSWNSPIRENAILLSTLLDLNPRDPRVQGLVRTLSRGARIGRWGTTQENAFALQAMGKAVRRAGAPARGPFEIVLPNGTVRRGKGETGLTLTDLPPDAALTLRQNGTGTLYAFWLAEGVPSSEQVPERDAGLEVRRSFWDVHGRSEIRNGRFTQGCLYQVRIALEGPSAADHLVVADLLPAGFEIEGAGTALPDAPHQDGETRLAIQRVERRDDRILVFCRISRSQQGVFRYLVRAVTPGTYQLPAISASCMYDPERVSLNGAGSVRIDR